MAWDPSHMRDFCTKISKRNSHESSVGERKEHEQGARFSKDSLEQVTWKTGCGVCWNQLSEPKEYAGFDVVAFIF